MITYDEFTALLAPAVTAPDAPSRPSGAEIAVIVAASDAGAHAAALAVARDWRTEHPDTVVVAAPPAAAWPFLHPVTPVLPADRAVLVWAPHLDEALANAQTGGVRLVTTQPAFLLALWRDALRAHGRALLLATADPTRLAARAPDAATGRGVWRHVHVLRGDAGDATLAESPHAAEPLPRAYRTDDAAARLRLCLEVLDRDRHAGTLVAAGSACVEAGDMDNAARLLDEAIAAAPDAAAAHFERGKLWLRRDDMERAAPCFAEAARLAPGFAPAAANLGATLGELGQTDEALAAFEAAREADPGSEQVLNNLGVLYRETGRLAESEATFRQAIHLMPEMAFGYYNLGHTLFLQGRYQASLTAYRQGQARDAARNPVQASRLALAELATGNAPAALAELQRCTAGLPRAYRQQLLADTHAVVWALLTHRPDLPGWKTVADWLGQQLQRTP
ncbi:MAG: tetratricopeptide repeat protein [Vicinamibacterales bacterium]|nr:tetratricopeptide repeat protein [Vicinamibacterales bacterium]